MTDYEKIEYLEHAMECYRGDNLERANMMWGHLALEEIDKEHDRLSGRTKRMIWEGYKKERDRWSQANDFLHELIKRAKT